MKKLHKFVFIYKEIKCAEFPAKVELIIDNSHLKSNSPPKKAIKIRTMWKCLQFI